MCGLGCLYQRIEKYLSDNDQFQLVKLEDIECTRVKTTYYDNNCPPLSGKATKVVNNDCCEVVESTFAHSIMP